MFDIAFIHLANGYGYSDSAVKIDEGRNCSARYGSRGQPSHGHEEVAAMTIPVHFVGSVALDTPDGVFAGPADG